MCLFVASMHSAGRVTLDRPAFYRFPENYTALKDQSAPGSEIYRFYRESPDLGRGGPPWPRLLRLRSGGSSHRRGRRAGRRLQWRRAGPTGTRRPDQRAECDRILVRLPRASPAGSADGGPGQPIPTQLGLRPAGWGMGRRSADTALAARCLVRPARLTQRQTEAAATPASRPPAPPTHAGDTQISTHGKLQLGHINAQSLMSSDKIDSVRLLLREQLLDCLCISETWATADAPGNGILLFPGFRVHRQDRQTPRRGRRTIRGGGVAILLREGLSAIRLKTTSNPAGRLETLWLSIAGRGARSAVVGVIYRPPDAPPADSLADLRDQLEDIISLNKPLFLLGDLNLDMLNADKPGVQQYVTMLHDMGLDQLIRQPTHPAATPTLIDHVITNIPDISHHASVIPCHFSDHDIITLNAPFQKTKPQRRQRTVRSTTNTDFDHLKLDLLLTDWQSMYNAESTDDKYTEFLNIWNRHMDLHCPLKTITFRHADCPWLTGSEELRDLQARRDAARRTRDVTGTDEAKQLYSALKREFAGKLREAKADFFKGNRTDKSKDMWSKLRKYGMASKQAKSVTELDPAVADNFNNYFASVGQRIADDLRREPSTDLSLRLPRVVSGAFRVRCVTLSELSVALQCMSSSKAVGPDGVCLSLLRECFAVVGPHLLHVVNHSLVTGRVPAIWKLATIVPLHKGGVLSEPSSFRPISVLSVVGKLAEKVVCTQLLEYVTAHHILVDSQYAYRPHHSTEDAVTDIVSHVITNMDSGMVTHISSTDLSKAFDCVDRPALLAKLECYGISTHWFADYFTDRRQTVRGGKAPSLDVTFGVVQGSIVGPLMFLLFTNDIQCYLSESCKLVSYADDTQLIHSAPPSANGITDLRSRVELDLAAISRWFHCNGLKINPSKTELIVIGTPAQTRKIAGLSITFGDVQLLPSDRIKILGVHLDKNLSWHYHTGKIAQRCFGSLVTINKLKHVLPRTTTKTLIECLVFPHIRYCLPAWAPATALQRKRVDKVINFAVRVATGKRKHDHITEARTGLGWFSFDQTVFLRDCISMYRVIHETDGPCAIRDLVRRRSEVSVRSTRATEDGTILQTSTLRHPRLEITKRSFPYRAVTAWNSLPGRARHSDSMSRFKKLTRSFIWGLAAPSE